MKIDAVEFNISLRLPQTKGGPRITGLVGRIDAKEGWFLDLDKTGYVQAAPKASPMEVTAYSPSVVKLVRFHLDKPDGAKPETTQSTKEATKKG